MAVYTPVPAEALADFLRPFHLGPLRSAKGVAEGVENTTYLLDAGSDRYILTLYEKRVDAADLPYFVSLADHLDGGAVPVPAVVRTDAGEAIGRLCDRPACLYRFHLGVAVTQPTPEQARAAGAALARLHLDLSGFERQRPNALGVQAWPGLAAALADRLDQLSPGLRREVAAALDRLADGWPADLPTGAIHADLFPDNVLMLGDRVTGVIDWTFACTDALAYDLAVAHGAWSFDADGRRHDAAVGSALVEGYRSVRPLTSAEQGALPLLAQGAALRFLLTRAHDWFATPADALVQRKDPLAYRARLRFYADPENAGVWNG